MKKIADMDEKDRAAKLFSERNENSGASSSDDPFARLNILKKISAVDGKPNQGEETSYEEEKKGPMSVADALRALKAEEQSEEDKYPKVVSGDVNAKANATLASMYQSGRANDNVQGRSDVIEVKKLSEKEQAKLDAQNAEAIERFSAGRHNKGFITEVKGDGVKYTKNLSANQVDGVTAGFRNVGFLTDVEPKTSTQEETRKEKIATLEALSSIVGAVTNSRLTDDSNDANNKGSETAVNAEENEGGTNE